MVKERKERGGKGANVMVIHSGGGVGKKSGGGGRKGIPSGVKHKMKKKKEREMLEKKGVVVKGSEDVKASKKRKRDEKDPSLSFGVAPGLDKSAIGLFFCFVLFLFLFLFLFFCFFCFSFCFLLFFFPFSHFCISFPIFSFLFQPRKELLTLLRARKVLWPKKPTLVTKLSIKSPLSFNKKKRRRAP